MPAGVPSEANVFEIGLSTVNSRAEPKNHSVSCLIGPPCVASKSPYRLA